MLTRLELTNFKSWARSEVRLAAISGFFGANSSGKTSLLQALLLLKQTAESADRALPLQFGDRGDLVSLGDFRSVVHRHGEGAELAIALDWRQKKPFVVTDPKSPPDQVVAQDDRLGITTRVRAENGAGRAMRLLVPEVSYRVGQTTFGMRRKTHGSGQYELTAANTTFSFLRHKEGRKWPLPPPTKCYGFPDQVRAYFQNAGFLSDLELAFEQELQRIYYLGPLRAYPERNYTWSGAEPSDMGQAGERAVEALLSARDRGVTLSRGPGRRPRATLEEYVTEWLQRLGLISEFRVEAVAEGSQLFQVRVRKTPGGAETLITDVGFGVSQILPVLVLCFYVPEGSTVILEQPEIHLHPAVQAGLADVLIDAHRKRKVQVLVESHSEHLLRRLQRRLAEGKLISREDVALYFCQADEQQSRLTPLDLDLFGNITNWPTDFFGDQLAELAATQEARLRRATKKR